MSYAAFMWWQKSEQTFNSTELLLTTGAVKCAPKIALEAMLDLSPLPGMVKKETA
jgi:hypothetical protein